MRHDLDLSVYQWRWVSMLVKVESNWKQVGIVESEDIKSAIKCIFGPAEKELWHWHISLSALTAFHYTMLEADKNLIQTDLFVKKRYSVLLLAQTP